MHARIDNPALSIPGALQAFQGLGEAVKQADVPETTFDLVELRASQINGCSICVDWHSRALEQAGEPDKRIYSVAAWREAPYYTDAERAALKLAEAVTRIADQLDPVPDEVWEEAAAHYDEAQLAALVIAIATINAFNRVNAATRQISGDWVQQFVGPHPPVEQAA
jgi:AhpD family alkylhydroperoxidase